MTEDFLKVQRNMQSIIQERLKNDEQDFEMNEYVCSVNAKIHPSLKHINTYEMKDIVNKYIKKQINGEVLDSVITVIYVNWRIVNTGWNLLIPDSLIFETPELSSYLRNVLNNAEYVQFQSRLERPRLKTC